MKRKSWTMFRKNIEGVIAEFDLTRSFKSINITQIENIDRRFMLSKEKKKRQSAK